tara:strand:+ start:2252 stop:4180 length:1929 start_codon:yes stop_codon:yes gene_type:complete
MSKTSLSKSRKKRIVYHSDFALLRTGFGRVAKLVLTHLYNTGKYDIIQLNCGLTDDNPSYIRVPWKNYGAMPADPSEIERVQRDPKLAQLASYGANRIDELMDRIKPDVYIGVQDIWGVDFAINKKWFPKINSLVWTTLDSLPVLPTAVEASKKVKNFWIWSDFATKALHKMGHDHVKTVRGPLNEDDFFRLKEDERNKLRKSFQIEDAFVVGFVFRNQLRKSVPNLLEGYKKFKDKNPKTKARLLLHTNFSEGWNILKLAGEYGIDKGEILCTYVCNQCNKYYITHFQGQTLDCPACSSKKSLNTVGIQHGVTEKQLNEIYNIMDVYCHPFTSGGQEIPIQEAKLAEKITLVTSYSCGEDSCVPEAASLPLEWSEYREHNTEFIKASTSSDSICEQLEKVHKMPRKEVVKMGKQARQWVIDNFSINKIGKIFEEFIDSSDFVQNKRDVYSITVNQNPQGVVNPELADREWVISMYKEILDMDVDENDKGYKYWISELEKGATRDQVDEYFRSVAQREILSKQTLHDFLDKDDEGRRILYVIPQSAGDVYMATSLFENLKNTYPNYNLYVATSPLFFEIIEGNPYVHKVIPYMQYMEDIHQMEGGGPNKGDFEIAFLSHVNAQRLSCYTHNGVDKIAFDIKA